MNLLIVNCGSSSLKFQLREQPLGAPRSGGGRVLASGRVQGIGGTAEVRLERAGAQPQDSRAAVADYEAAVRLALEWLAPVLAGRRLDGVGHRFVHGGATLYRPARIDTAVRAELHALEALAPLHNRPSLAGVDAVQAALGESVPQVAVFDTAFHHDLPPVAQTYGIPTDLAAQHGIRRYGFHGSSCRSVLDQYAERADAPVPAERARLIVLHLGSGCSATAVRSGLSMDTTMGFTPLEGLLMGTRCGDLDPAVPLHLARRAGMSLDAVERMLNEASGLKGVSGLSADLRTLLAQEAQQPAAHLAVELFCYRARKTIGSYLAALEGADAVLFTGGVGEHAPAVRARICAPLAWCGLHLDAVRNEAAQDGGAAQIGAPDAAIQAYVLPSDEERIIAWDTARCLG